jgi:hypothetical protein
LTFADGSYYEG